MIQIKYIKKENRNTDFYDVGKVWCLNITKKKYYKIVWKKSFLNNRFIIIKLILSNMETPEEIMKKAFHNLSETRKYLEQAKQAYITRNSSTTADPENANNIDKSIKHLGNAYDEISAIWENDINV